MHPEPEQPTAEQSDLAPSPLPIARLPELPPPTEKILGYPNKKNHFVTVGERKFDRLTYNTIGYVANAVLSVAAVWWAERVPSGQRFIERFGEWTKRNLSFMSAERAEFLARKTFFLFGGFAVLWPMKWLEDHKVELIKKWDKHHYGNTVTTDPEIVQSHHDLETAPKQNWLSVMGSRALALIPFYITIGALWERKSLLAKATNPELRALEKAEIKAMEKEAPEKFSQLASKGVYFDKPIGWVSRKIGKGWASLTGNTAALEKLREMETKFPGTIRSEKMPNGSHDPMHSTLPYYFISEAITSGMVAWGVYVLTRALGPIIGKKQAPVVEEKAPVAGVAQVHSQLDAIGPAALPVRKALEAGVTIAPMPGNAKEDVGGYYDADSNTVYLNTHRPRMHQMAVLVHECQHACNLLEGAVADKNEALKKGEAVYKENFLRDEALAHAASFIFAHETKSQSELAEPAMQALFKDVSYEGSSPQALQRYADHAMAHLHQGALGYAAKAQESYEARKQEEQKVPNTAVALNGLEREPVGHSASHALAHSM